MSHKKTIEEKKANGSYRPCKDGYEDPPRGELGRPSVPDCLTPSQVKVFNKTCDLLENNEWLRVSDGPSVHAFTILQDRLNQDQESFTAADFTQFRLLCNELGMSPAARAKMPLKPKEEEKNDFDFD